MDKKVSVKNIDKIMKYNKYENKIVTYTCGDENIDITVVPYAGLEHRLVAIATGVSLIDEDVENKYALGVKSLGLKLAVVINFTEMKNTISNAKLIDFIETTDVVEKIKEVLPASVYDGFAEDYNAVADMITTGHINEKKDAFYTKMSEAVGNIKEFLKAMNEVPIEGLDDVGGELTLTDE